MKRDRAQPLSLPAGVSETSSDSQLQTGGHREAGGIAGWLLRRLLAAAGNPPVSIMLWDRREIRGNNRKPEVRIHIGDRGALIKMLLNPDLEFGELYTEGRLRVDGDLVLLMETINNHLPDYRDRGWLPWLLSQLYLIKRNSLERARDNIHHHYDLGNDFYKLWLDERMVYTCAYFPRPDLSIEQAQLAKLDHVSRKLRLQPGEMVAEAGCGWGALALHMAKFYGVRVKAFNISKEQLAYARERARNEGLSDRVEFIEGDYREMEGQVDAFVSVGMLEHVGKRHYREMGEVVNRVLAPHGRGLIHTIGRNRPAPMNAWIERRIFPGAYPPSPSELMTLFEPWSLSVLDMENLRLHYAETLRHWLERFSAHVDQVRQMFDERFVRAWELYLAGSMSAFSTGELQLFQVVFTRHHHNDIPWTRDFLYPGD